MITKMKKLMFLVYHKDYERFLTEIRELGVIHVAERQQGTPDNTELQDSIRLSARLDATIKLLENTPGAKGPQAEAHPARALQVMEQADELLNRRAALAQQMQSCNKELDAWRLWGDFDPGTLKVLREKGWQVGFYIIPESSYDKRWEQEYNAFPINRVASKIYFITVTPTGADPELDAEQVKWPDYSVAGLEMLIEETEQEMADNEEQLSELAAQLPTLKAARQDVQQEIEFSKVILNTEQTAGEKLMLLQGWAPATKTGPIVEYLRDKHIYYEVSDPLPGDNVPIELNNKGFFGWFEPITRLYMLPKYSELDLTPFFAPFFMVFFGLCLGDSGYGLFLFLCATGYRLVAKNISVSMKGVLSLIQILAVSTFFCGLLTGTFFGFNLYDLDIPFIQRLRDAIQLDNNDLFELSLILGAVQILFGMVLKAVNQTIQFGFRYAVATVGWIILLVSTAFAALVPSVLPLGSTVYWIFAGVAGAMIFLFNSPGKNILVNIGLGFWDSYNMATGLLGDILSYVRLFALGLSGGILAGVFNSLAVGMSPDNVIAGPIVMVLIFLIGHAINMFMNVLGAMVHPMRLTFVEFFKNSGYEGGGKEYKPFKK